MISFVILGTPVAKGRPRISTRGGFARAYTPKATRNAEANIRVQIINQLPEGFKPLQNAISVELIIGKVKPTGTPKKVIYPIKRPDLDNYIKSLFDAMNSIVFNDDAQIVELRAVKRFGEVAETIINIGEMK
jgi:Holliday junction resolvase RusA-like endonuclease